MKRGEAIRRFVTVRRRKDNTLVDVSVTLSPVRVNGEFVAISEIVRDVSESRRNTETLGRTLAAARPEQRRHHRARWPGQIGYWNHGAEEMYGWSREEALGKEHLYELLHTEFLTVGGAAAVGNGRWDGRAGATTRDGAVITVQRA